MNIFVLKYKRSGIRQTIETQTLERYEDKNVTVEFSSLNTKYGNRIMVILKPKMSIVLDECKFTFDMAYDYKTITTNGYQSSTESLESNFKSKLKQLNFAARIFSLANIGDYKLEKYFNNKGILSHTYIHFTREDNKQIRFYGSVNEENAYTIFNLDKTKNSMCIYSDCKHRMVDENFTLMDFVIAEGAPYEVYDHYMNFFPQKNNDSSLKHIWISPYNVKHNAELASEAQIEKNASQIKTKEISVNTIIVNETYQNKIGDYFDIDTKRFPNGMKGLADIIKDNGYKAGIWLAPFIAEKKSKLYKEHPTWFLQKTFHLKVVGGYNPSWSSKYYVLDIYNEEAYHYITDLFKTVFYEWGFDVVYLDLIYAAAVEARIDKTRAEIMRDVSKFVNKACKGKTVIAASAPIGSAFGEYGYCKISVDNAPFWEDTIMKNFGFKERVSTENALNTTIARRYLNKNMFRSISTSYFIGSEDTQLTLLEKHTLLTLNSLLTDSMIISDKIESYDDIELSLLKKIFPSPDIKKIHHDEKDNIHTFEFIDKGTRYLVVSNFNKTDKEFIIPKGIYCGKYGALLPSNCALSLKMHQTQVLTKIDLKKPIQPIYSDAHILPLYEIKNIKYDDYESENKLSITFKTTQKSTSTIYFLASKDSLSVNGQPCKLIQNYGERYIFAFEADSFEQDIDEFKIEVKCDEQSEKILDKEQDKALIQTIQTDDKKAKKVTEDKKEDIVFAKVDEIQDIGKAKQKTAHKSDKALNKIINISNTTVTSKKSRKTEQNDDGIFYDAMKEAQEMEDMEEIDI